MQSFLRAAKTTAATLVLLATVSVVARAQSTFKIAFVSPAALIDNAPGRAAADSLFSKETQAYSDQLKRMNDSLNSMILNYQKAEPTLNATQKDTRTKAIQAYEQDFRGKQQQLQQQADPNLILAYDKNLDITDRVVARLRTVAANGKPAAPKPGAVQAPAGVTRKP
jgi:Skp family chaperone for outer membrane proteins